MGLGGLANIVNEGAHLICSQGTVETNGHRVSVLHRNNKCLSSLSTERASRHIDNSSRNKDGRLAVALGEAEVDGVKRSLGVKGIENGFNQENISASIQKTFSLLLVCIDQLIKGDVSESRVLDRG